MYHGVRIDVINDKFVINDPMFHPFIKTSCFRVATMKIDKVLDRLSINSIKL